MAKKKAKAKRKRSGRLTSTIGQHRRIGKVLVPPILTVPGITFQSWTNNRLPEMLWACLVISVLPRVEALAVFRDIASAGLRYRGIEEPRDFSLTHSHLPEVPSEIIRHIVAVVTRHPLGYAALRPLLLLEGLPGRDQWASALQLEPQDSDWQTLGRAVLASLDHQSQQATDVRWLTVLFHIALGRLRYPPELGERFKEIVEYPNRGDMRSVRPSIRAMEGSFTIHEAERHDWSDKFWKECLDKTGCMPVGPPRPPRHHYDQSDCARQIQQAYEALLEHWSSTLTTTGVDARHDATFGFALFALSALLEMTVGRNGSGITGVHSN